VLWFFLTYDTPGSHPRISAAERDYIENSIGRNKNQKKSMHVPWCAMFTSLPFYAAGVAQFTCLWGYYTLLNTLPLYFKNIMFFDIKQNGALSGAPYLAMWFMMVFSGWLADKLRAKNILSTTNVRKVYMAIGFLIPAACLVATGFVDCHHSGVAVALVIVAVGFAGPAFGAWNVNLIDIAPSYAGTMLGITNTVGTVPGFVGTLVVSAFTSGNQTVEAWRNVFYVTASIYVGGTIFYLIFGSGELQPWAVEPHKVDDIEIQSLEDGVKKKSSDNGNLPEKA
jgi:ACS family sodium-dependent inorganic phosphate cotransporter-like MFS transporter 5